MPRCVNCGIDVVPVRPKIDWGCVIAGCLLGPIGILIAMVYQLSKPADRCPACGATAYVRQASRQRIAYCTKCGKKLTPHAEFCTSCGTKVG